MVRPDARDPRAWALLLAGIVAGFLYSNFILDVMISGNEELLAVVSDLEAPGKPNATVLRITDQVAALCTLALLPWVRAALPAGRLTDWTIGLTATFAVLSGLAGIVTLPCASDVGCSSTSDQVQRLVHDGVSVLSTTALFVAALLMALDARRHGPDWLVPAGKVMFWFGGGVLTIGFLYFGYQDSTSWQTGVVQRAQILMMSGWLVMLGWLAAGEGLRHRDAPRPEPTR